MIGKKCFRFIALLFWLLRKIRNLDGNLTNPNDMEKVVAIQSGLGRFNMKLQVIKEAFAGLKCMLQGVRKCLNEILDQRS